MKSQASITIALFAIILVSCAPISTPELIDSTSTNTPEPIATLTPEPIATLTPEPAATFTPEPTFTPTPQLLNLQVFAFWDYNGNGKPDEGEPPLKGIINKIAGIECITGEDGICTITLSNGGYYAKFITAGAVDPSGIVPDLDYLFYGTDVLKPSNGYQVILDSDTTIYAALGQGFFPIPVSEESFEGVSHPFGERYWDNSIPGYRTHLGYDVLIRGSSPQPIYSPVSGFLQPDPNGGWGECNQVNIRYNKLGFDFVIGIGHLTEVVVKPNQPILKGEIIGYIDPGLYNPGFVACTSVPHIHIGFWGSVNGRTYNTAEGALGGSPTLLANGEWGWVDPAFYFPKKGEPIPQGSLAEAP